MRKQIICGAAYYVVALYGVVLALAACHGGGPANVSLGEGTRYVNNTGSAQWVHLPDSSLVKISSGTVIMLGSGFAGGNRSVDLDGEGMFEVRASAAGPFVVTTKNLIIEVLGTKFRVDAVRKVAGEEVDLLEGKLRVSKNYHSDLDSIPEVMEASDMVMFNREIDLMEKEKMDAGELNKVKEKF